MEVRQLQYFVCAVEQGSLGKAARKLGVVTSTLSQQISRLESELSTRLMQRTTTGVVPTDAGLAFFQRAQLALRNIDAAAEAARHARLSGHVSVGLAPTTAGILALPLIREMRKRYPDVQLHLIGALSGHLSTMLNARQLDLAILFNDEAGRKWSSIPLLTEQLYLIAARDFKSFPQGSRIPLSALAGVPLVMPTHMHGLRSTIASAVYSQTTRPDVVMEVDSLAILMDVVAEGIAATIQPGVAIIRKEPDQFRLAEISDPTAIRNNLLVGLSDDELSPAALATRVVIRDVVRSLVVAGRWKGATLTRSSATQTSPGHSIVSIRR